MPIFLLIRHGETDFNKKMHLAGRLPDVHLNKKGPAASPIAGRKAFQAPIKAIYASPLERTMDTAAPLAKALKLEITPMPDLLETDCGDWQGQSVKKLRRRKSGSSYNSTRPYSTFPGGESIS